MFVLYCLRLGIEFSRLMAHYKCILLLLLLPHIVVANTFNTIYNDDDDDDDDDDDKITCSYIAQYHCNSFHALRPLLLLSSGNHQNYFASSRRQPANMHNLSDIKL